MWWFALAWAADCPEPTSRQALVDILTEADVAVLTLDADGLAGARAAIDAKLPCLDEALDPGDVAWTFRVVGMADFIADSDRALSSFISARALAPDYKLSSSLGGSAHALWAAAVVPPSEAIPLPKPLTGWLLVDGSRSSAAPGGRAFLFQWLDADGVKLTARVDDVAKLPAYPSVPVRPSPVTIVASPPPEPEPEPEPQAPSPKPVRHTSRPMVIGAAASGVGAVGLTLVAASLRQQFLNSDQSSDALEGTIAANRAAGGGALALGAACVGLGAGAVVVGRW